LKHHTSSFATFFFTDNLLEKIVTKPRCNSIQKDPLKPYELCVTDLRRYIGICIFMSIIHFPSSRDKWSDILGNQHIKEAMSVNMFESI
jgi:hypothetical protein